MIPSFDSRGKLPPGIHWATWDEVVARFGTNFHRRRLLRGLRRAKEELEAAGCEVLYVDGSFVTSKREPRDYDACWHAGGRVATPLHRSLIDYHGDRSDQLLRYGGEIFPAAGSADARGTTFLELFQMERFTGRPKGIVAIRLGAPV